MWAVLIIIIMPEDLFTVQNAAKGLMAGHTEHADTAAVAQVQ